MSSDTGSKGASDGAHTRPRPTVTFADEFDPRGLDARDNGAQSPIVLGSEGVRSRTASIPSRKTVLDEASSFAGLLDDNDGSKSPRRSISTFGPVSMGTRGAIPPPFGWHPSGVFYRFTILGLVAFILLAGYFSDETIGATNSELSTCMRFA